MESTEIYTNEKLKEFNQYIRGRRVAVIGLGVSNIPLLDYLYNKGAKVTAFDSRDIDDIPKNITEKITNYSMAFSFGENYLNRLHDFDVIFRSPSCLPTKPEIEAEVARGAILTTEVEMVMQMCPGLIIGVTGSDGKTTTTTLIYEILTKEGYNCFLGGNIGVPLFTRIEEMRPEDIIILELSSFQLMGMQISPHISVITNITPNHLNIHSSYEEYIEAKKNIFKHQSENGIVVLNYDNDITRQCAKEAVGKVRWFSGTHKLDDGFIVDSDVIKECDDKIRKHILNTKNVNLRGRHNYENICTALAATKDLVSMDNAIKTVSDFKGVEHRLELVREIDGVKWFNDSVSSSPTRTIAGLNSYSEDIILIAGGYDKNLDYTPLAKPILEKVKVLILLGATSGKIFDSVKAESEKQGKNIEIYMCEDLKQTVELAKRVAKEGQVVLFSPASASFDLFKNFADRGEKFKELVNNL